MAACFDFGRLSRPNKKTKQRWAAAVRPMTSSMSQTAEETFFPFGYASLGVHVGSARDRKGSAHDTIDRDKTWSGLGGSFLLLAQSALERIQPLVFMPRFSSPSLYAPMFFWVCGGCRPACTARFPSISKFNMSSYCMGGMLVRDKVVFLSLKSSVFIS